MNLRGVIALLAVLLISPGVPDALAQTDLAKMVIINRVPQPLHDIPASVTLIDRSNIVSRTALSVGDVLRDTPGVHVQGSAYPGVPTKPIMRGHAPGLQSKRVLVLVDGRRVAEPFQGGVEFALFQGDNIERIELLRGPGSALYGSDALAGVISIVTRRGAPDPVAEVRAAYGSYDLYQARAAAGWAQGPLDYFVTASTLATDGYTDNRDGTDRDWEAEQVTGNFGLALGDQSELRLHVGAYEASGTDDDSDREIEKDYLHGVYTWTWDEAREATLVARAYRNGDDQVYNWKFPGVGAFDMETVGGEIQQSLWAGDRQRLAAGADFRSEAVSVRNITGPIDEDSRVVGFYLQDEMFVVENVSLTLGLRVDDDDDFGSELSPRVAVLWHPDAGTDVYASFNRAHRAPALSDRFFRGEFDGRIFEGNPDLEPETVTAYEVGVRKRLDGGVQVEGAAFYNDLEDSFEFAMDVDGVFRNRNIARSQLHGLEGTIRCPATDTIDIIGTYTYTDGEYDEFPSAPEVEGNELQYLAMHTASVAVEYTGPLGFHALAGRYVDDRYADDRNTAATRLDDYLVVDWRSRVPLGDRLVLTLNIDNLLDVSYDEYFGIEQPGTTVLAGLEASL